MSPRAGVEAEAIERLTEGVRPPEVRAILLQCLSGEITPSAAIRRMLAETVDVSIVRGAIDDVTRRAASISRAKDMLVHDRVDDLTQLFVEQEPGYSIRRAPDDMPAPPRASAPRSGDAPEAQSDQPTVS